MAGDIVRERMNIYISTDLKRKLKEKADEMGMNMSAFVSLCVNDYLKQDSVCDMALIFKEMQKQAQEVAKKG